MTKKAEFAVGIDFGSVSTNLVTIDLSSDNLKPTHIYLRPSRGVPVQVAGDLVSDLGRQIGFGSSVKVGFTGVAHPALPAEHPIAKLNEVVAAAAMVANEAEEAETIIDLGGQFSKWIRVDRLASDRFARVKDFTLNGLCAAGSGSFLEQQASRLNLDLDHLGHLAAQAAKGATIAGRCSVFAKSDMIHLQQKGTPVDEVAYGLCLALARTFITTVLQGRVAVTPVAFVGGGAANPGLIRAFQEVLKLNADAVRIPEHYRNASAIGTALFAAGQASMTLGQVAQFLDACQLDCTGAVDSKKHLRPLSSSVVKRRELDPTSVNATPCSTPVAARSTLPVYLGVDVGSVSTNVVLLNSELALIDKVYLPTSGQPIVALHRAFARITEIHGSNIEVLFVGATGSGRCLVERIAGADVVKNEITAQLTGTLHYFPQVDTIFEIGGQDSKYVSVKKGRLKDFEMNKICAAGTGSFLEEQAERLGVAIIGEFSERAFLGKSPAALGGKCTVFMDTELCQAMGNKTPVEDLCAGLAYAVAKNYLEKVVGGRDVGESIVFQGGTSANGAVVSAFETLLGRPIQVHPHGDVSGAIGAALLAAREYKGDSTAFRGFAACADHVTKSFTCKRCDNRCQVNRITVGERVAHFGDVCEHYTTKDRTDSKKQAAVNGPPDLFAKRAEILRNHLPPARRDGRPTVGLLRTSLSTEWLPFFATLVDQLGFRAVMVEGQISDNNFDGVGLPQEVCLPLKLAGREVKQLLEVEKVGKVLVPAIQNVPTRQPKDRPNTCLYAQYLPDMLRRHFAEGVCAPQFHINDSKETQREAAREIARALGVPERKVKKAWPLAAERQRAFSLARQSLGREITADLPPHSVVVIGKPYNVHDSAANLNLVRHLHKAGLCAIPFDILPLDDEVLPHSWYMLAWHLNRDQVRALQFAAARTNLFPIHVSSYGCGPDAFTLKHLEPAWGDRPRLFLEFDEHKGEAGLITRIEAFVDEVDDYLEHGPQLKPLNHPPRRRVAETPKGTKVFLPYTSEHVYAYAGALGSVGYRTEIMAPPSEESIRLGEEVSSERECHPFSIIAGDLVALSRQSDLEQGDAFFLPTTRLPCLLCQYGDGLRKVRADLGETRLRIFDPHPGEFGEILGPVGYMRLYEGLSLLDSLIIFGSLLRSREINTGDVDRALNQCYKKVQKCLEGKANAKKCLAECMAILQRVPLGPDEEKPLIGITGDLYTRLNAAGNAGLFRRLESSGCIVWPSPFYAASVDFEVPQNARRFFARGEYKRAFKEASSATILRMRAERVVSALPASLRSLCVEPPFATLQGYAEEYTGANANHLIRGIVAKMVDFARRGADGVINAIGVGCMVGVSASSTIQAIRADYQNIPIITITYGGREGPSQQIQLETFLHQVRQRFRQRQS